MAKRLVSLDTKEIESILNGTIDPVVEKRLRNAMKTIKPRSAKSKGSQLQKDFCELIASITGSTYIPGDDDSQIKSRPMGLSGSDIILDKATREKFPFTVEAKNTQSFNLLDTVEQAKSNEVVGTDWLIVHRRKELKEDVVIMSVEAFTSLMERIEDYRSLWLEERF